MISNIAPYSGVPTLLFSAKKKKKPAQPPPNNPTPSSSNTTASASNPSPVADVTQSLAQTHISSTSSADTFQKSTAGPSLTPIHEMLEQVEQSDAFTGADTHVKHAVTPILQKAKSLTARPEILPGERLQSVNQAARELFKATNTRGDLLQRLRAFNVPVMEPKEHGWVQNLFKQNHANALFMYPATLYKLDPDWKPAKPFAFPGSDIPEYLALGKTLNAEKTVRILASETASEERKATEGENAAAHDLKHESYHYLQFIMGVPFKGPSREADYQAHKVKTDFIQKLQKMNSTDKAEKKAANALFQKLQTEMMDDIFKDIMAPMKRFQALQKEMAQITTESQLIQQQALPTDERGLLALGQRAAAVAKRFETSQKAMEQVQKEMAAAQKTEQWKEMEKLFTAQGQAPSKDDPAFQEAYMTMLKKAASATNVPESPHDPSLGAAIRRVARREMEVYDALIQHKDEMGIDSKYNLANLTNWVFYKMMERHSHRFDPIVYPDAK